MNGFVLRIIAMSTMLLDHIGWFFLENPMTLTWIGRIAFPVYAFLLAEGFIHIRNDRRRLSSHLEMLLILTIISEVAFDLMDTKLDFAHYMDFQSNMVTLLLGYAGMMVTELILASTRDEKKRPSRPAIAALVCAYALLAFANYMMKGNFNIVGPLLVMAFYWFIIALKAVQQSGRIWSWGKRFSVILMIIVLYLIPYFWVRCRFGDFGAWWKQVVDYAPWVVGHALAGFIISLYNGALGYHQKWFSRLYLSFYPAHAVIIGIIRVLTVR